MLFRPYQRAANQSLLDFQRHVQKPLEECLGGKIIQIEDKKELAEIAHAFDINGIDAFRVDLGGALFGIASRVVRGTPRHSFTVRHTVYDRKTRHPSQNCEFHKRLATLNNRINHQFFPDYTVQSHCTDEALTYCYAVKTEALIRFIEANKENKRLVTSHYNEKGGNRFYAVSVETLITNGIDVKKAK